MLTLDPTLWSVQELSSRLVAQEISPVEVVEAFLAKIGREDERLRAFIDVYSGEARLAAEAAHKAIRSGHAVGPYHGIPIALKDLIDIEGRITTAGSCIWRNRRATRTATVVRKLRAHGLIVLGKTHTPEFALGGWGLNQHLGTPRNPWDSKTHRIPGGSSSGSAVAVAARLSPWAVGTDTGGSVRLPAALCGVVGFKPSKGRISSHGVVPLSPTLDTLGQIVRSVEDAALLFELMQGPDPADPSTSGITPIQVLPMLKQGIGGLRLGRLDDANMAGVEPDVLAAYDASLDRLTELGAYVVPVAMPRPLREYSAKSTIMMAEAHALYGALAADRNVPMDEFVRGRMIAASRFSTADYINALDERRQLREEFHAVFDQVDAILTPTIQAPAAAVDQIDRTKSPIHFSRCANLLNLCALAIPNGFSANDLPISLQIMTPEYDETTALRIGWAYEAATHWHQRQPQGGAAIANEPNLRESMPLQNLITTP